MSKKIIPLNVDKDGNARCITAGCYKFGFTNLMQIGWSGTTATIIAEVEEEEENVALTCAIRNRSDGVCNKPNFEIGNDIANDLTSIEKDRMIFFVSNEK